VREMAEAPNLDDYQILTSVTEYKKSSMAYFQEEIVKDGKK